MIKAIIISGIAFTIGNIVWPYFNEPKLFYVPLAVFIWLLVWHLWKSTRQGELTDYFLMYLFWLAFGNIIKQLFYTKTLKQINDYYWGGLVTLALIALLIRWAILNNRRKSGARG